MRRSNLGGQLRHSQIPLFADPAGDPVLQPGKLAIPATIALGFRGEPPSCLLQLDHIVDKLHGNPKPSRRKPMRVLLSNELHNALSQLNRMRLADH
jgi:hypothetical protein